MICALAEGKSATTVRLELTLLSHLYAGVVRNYGMNKGSSRFAEPAQLPYLFDKELPQRIKALEQSVNNQEKYIDGLADLHSTLDLAHPFREGNGRSTRIFMSQLSEIHEYTLDFSHFITPLEKRVMEVRIQALSLIKLCLF